MLYSKSLKPDKLVLTADELAFYKKHTGIENEQDMKGHITDVARNALEIYPYPCIRKFGFLRFRITRSPSGYKRLLELGSTRPNALLLDLGCCFGNDVRKAIDDGFPPQNVVASDLRAEYWKFGHDLFKSTPSTFPVIFIPGDVLDPSFISIQAPLQTTSATSIPLQSILQSELGTLKSLDPLRGHLSAIHTSAFFHLFNREEQLLIAKKLASLLSPLPGSIIFGSHLGFSEPHEEVENGTGISLFGHSLESWKKMWEEEVFTNGITIHVDADMPVGETGEIQHTRMINWVVTRL
ncbi:hypothetical protein BDP27DRAFT_1273795 [Rhodocollybia butyracea]|uniref:Methyltransferase ausD n=1 Tax=Rhodocollybia butyracea TaxID=206335 RepID=A0A9P5PB45_9AGAR|nr:hypothetical protein BDP27DRAFT_1273795 [Rhodocollybia butyracea]